MDFAGEGTDYTVDVVPDADGEVSCQVPAGSATDAAGNNSVASNKVSVIYDGTGPTCTVTGPASPTSTTPLVFNVTFSESVTGFTQAGVQVTGGSAAAPVGSGANYTVSVTPSGDGTVTFRIVAGAAEDEAGNPNAGSNIVSVIFSGTAPSCVVTGPASPTNQNPIQFVIEFSKPVTGLTAGKITVTGGTKGALTAIGQVGGFARLYRLPVTPVADGTVSCQVPAGAAQDAVGKNNTQSNALSVIYDGTPPTCVVSGPSGVTKLSPINFTITFSETVSGFDASRITVVGGTKGTFTGTGKSYTISVTPTGQGVVTCYVSAGSALDVAGNPNTASNTASVTFDAIPTVTVTGPPSPTSTLPITFNIAFSETVTGLTADGIKVTGGAKGALTGSGAAYTIQVTPASQGVVTCQVLGGAAQDGTGNKNIASATASVEYDTIPTCVVTGPASPTDSAPINFTLTFSEDVTLDAGSILVSGGTIADVVGDGSVYTVSVTPSGDGDVSCQVPAGAAVDGRGNFNTASNVLVISYDGAPGVVVTAPEGPTNQNPLEFTIQFTEPVTGFTLDDPQITGGTKLSLTGSGSIYVLLITPTTNGEVTCAVPAGVAVDSTGHGNTSSNVAVVTYDAAALNCTITGPVSPTNDNPIRFNLSFSKSVPGLNVAHITVTGGSKQSLTGDGLNYVLSVLPSVDGTVTCELKAGVVRDPAGNFNLASNKVTVVYDGTPPSSSVSGSETPTKNPLITFAIGFSEPVYNLTMAGIQVTGATKQTLVGSGTSYTLTVTATGGGNVTCQVPAGSAYDLAGNGTLASNIATVFYDTSTPSCTVSSARAQTNASPITFEINFGKTVIGLTEDEVVVTGGTKGVLSGGGSAYSIPVIPSGEGTVTCMVPAGAAVDSLGNPNLASNLASVVYDVTSPTCSVTGTVTTKATFTITFSEPVQGFSLSGISVTNGSPTKFTGTGANYLVEVTPAGDGFITCRVNESAATDLAGNGNIASNTASVTFNGVPTCVVSSPTASTKNSPINFSIVFSKAVTGLAMFSIDVTNGTKSALTGSGSAYTLQVIPAGEGNVTCRVRENVAFDSSTPPQGNTASNTATVYFDSVPSCVVTAPASPTHRTPVEFVITFSEPVIGADLPTVGDPNSGLDMGKINVTGGTKQSISPLIGPSRTYTLKVNPSGDGIITCQVPSGTAVDVTRDSSGNYVAGENQNTASNAAVVEYSASVANNLCSNPTVIASLPFVDSVSTRYADESAGDPVLACVGEPKYNTIWYSLTLSSSVSVGIDTSGSNYDTVVAVYTGGCDSLVNVVCDNDSGDNGASRLAFDAAAGTTYIIEVASYFSGGGDLSLRVSGTDTVPPIVTALPPGRTYNANQTVELLADEAATIYYTTDGTEPTASSFVYTAPLLISSVTVLKFFGIDTAGNVGPVITETYTFDRVVPTCTVTGPASPTNVSPVNFTISFSETVIGLTADGVIVTGGVKGDLTGSGSTYSISVVPDGDGNVTLLVPAGSAEDAAGNANLVSNTVTVRFEGTRPTCTVVGPTSPTSTSPLLFRITFSKAVTGLVMGGITVTGGTKSSLSPAAGPAASYILSVLPAGDGPVTCQVTEGAASDALGNLNLESEIVSVIYDTTNPECVVTGPSLPTRTSPVTFSLVFSEPVTGLTVEGISVTGGSKGTLSGSGANYTISVNVSAAGSVTCQVLADAAVDGGGRKNRASNIAAATFDNVAPTLTIVSPAGGTTVSRTGSRLTISGTASDLNGIGSVSWTNDRGGSGLCDGTESWSAAGIELLLGRNVITVTGRDVAGNVATGRVTVNYLDVSPGDAWLGLTMVGVPIIPDNTDPKEAIGFYGNEWVSYIPSIGNYAKYPDARTFLSPAESTPGRGFWAFFSESPSAPSGVIPPQDAPATIRLQPGWNMIGQPFLSPVLWSRVDIMVQEPGKAAKTLAESAGVCADYAWGWEQNSSDPRTGAYYLIYDSSVVPGVVGELAPWRAYWLKASKVCDLILPAP